MRYGPSSFITMKKITCSRLKLDSDFYSLHISGPNPYRNRVLKLICYPRSASAQLLEHEEESCCVS